MYLVCTTLADVVGIRQHIPADAVNHAPMPCICLHPSPVFLPSCQALCCPQSAPCCVQNYTTCCILVHLVCLALSFQGALDPLNDAKGRAAELGRLCPEYVTVQLLQAGHCPHDEVPDQVAQHMVGFMKQVMQRSTTNNTAAASVAA
jgi:hypothetical protein